MANEIAVADTTIVARDGYALAATVYEPERPWRATLLSSATAVPRKIYRAFATFLAENGFAVLTYDYRGIGGSRPKSLKGFEARMRDWASLDVSAAIGSTCGISASSRRKIEVFEPMPSASEKTVSR